MEDFPSLTHLKFLPPPRNEGKTCLLTFWLLIVLFQSKQGTWGEILANHKNNFLDIREFPSFSARVFPHAFFEIMQKMHRIKQFLQSSLPEDFLWEQLSLNKCEFFCLGPPQLRTRGLFSRDFSCCSKDWENLHCWSRHTWGTL